ncbi:AMP-binding protein [Mariprofundus sp. NF]|uniref:AMP-binding protein n=1 Tax=Mariprofundus sp. NF TaxID=2608716 RepID=UPI0015A2C0FF|nr:AMP-binding protein [Mariprofundus sp. NF]
MGNTAKESGEIERLFSNRFASETGSEKKVLLQGIKGSLVLSIIRSALQNGWTVAIIREDASNDYLQHAQSELGSHLHVVAHQDYDAPLVYAGPDCKPLDLWLSENRSASSARPYAWREDECALILFTSGSTGMPKGVCHSLGNIIRSAELFSEHFEIDSSDHLYCLAPIHSMSGLRSLLLPLVSEAAVTIADNHSAPFLSIIKEIPQLKPTKIVCGPVFIKQLAAYGKRIIEHIQSVEALLCTGADLDEADRATVMQVFGVPVVNYYGLTETAGIVLAETIAKQTENCLPPPCEGCQIVLTTVEDSSQLFQLGITGPNMFLGYLGEPLLRTSSFDTGDLVQKTAHEQLRLVGRSSGAVKAPTTEWIFPSLLEGWLKSQANIDDAVVKGCRISGGYGVEIWVECSMPFDYSAMDKSIVQQFGIEYMPAKWHNAVIKRNPLGKVDQIIEKTGF